MPTAIPQAGRRCPAPCISPIQVVGVPTDRPSIILGTRRVHETSRHPRARVERVQGPRPARRATHRMQRAGAAGGLAGVYSTGSAASAVLVDYGPAAAGRGD